MPRRWQELPVNDFTGGITDYVDNAQANQSADIENLIISRDNGLTVREGSIQWHPDPLPDGLKALQLFQLEEYIFAYTDDGDIYWCFQDATGGWTKILTAADIGNDWGGDFFKSGTDVLYIQPDDSIQAVQPWNTIKFECIETVNVGVGVNFIQVNDQTDVATGLHYFQFEFVYFDANPKTFNWTSTLTDILNSGLNAQGPWSVFLNEELLTSGHSDILIDTITDGTTELDFDLSGQTDYQIKPIYAHRVKPFVNSTFNGALSVSKFSGHLYLAMYPDDRNWTANSADVFSDQPDIFQIDNKRLPLRKIYLLYDPDTDTTTPKCTSAQLPNVDIWAEAEDGQSAGDLSGQYIYEGYARQTYNALVEGEPRLFIVDGPSIQYSYLTEFEVDPNNNVDTVKVSGRILPRVQYDVEIYDLNELEYRFFRSQFNGTVPTLVSAVPGIDGLIYPNWTDGWGTLDPDLESKWNTGDGDEKGLFYYIEDTSRVDITEDTDIAGTEEAYDATTDFGYINVPQGPYYFTVSNQIGYYSDIFKLKNRVYQSIYGVPHANISISFLDFDDGITGINTFRDKAIVFTLESVWRMEGVRGLDGLGSISQRLVSDEFGSISNQSIVRTNYGLFFFSRTGICYTDGLTSLRVSEQLFDSYYDLIVDVDYIRSFYHESQQRIYWSVKRDNKTYWCILHLRFGITPVMPVTFATGVDWLDIPNDDVTPYTTVDRFNPQVSMVNAFDKNILRHSEGYVLEHDTPHTTDVYPIMNQVIPILHRFKSRAFDMQTKKYRKWIANVMMIMKEFAEAGVSIQPTGFNDLAPTEQLLATCFNYGKMEWGDDEQTWGNKNADWNAHKNVNFRRMFPTGSVRAVFKQFGFKSLYVYGFGTTGSNITGKGTYTSIVNGSAYNTYITLPITLVQAKVEAFTPTTTNSGQFAIKLPRITGKQWNIIHKVVDNGGSIDVYIQPDLDADIGQVITNIEYVVGYIRTQERIGLDHFSLRYTMIGEFTHGAYSNTDGGAEGDGTAG